MYCIYKITDLRSDEVIYIGKTKDFNSRRSFHFTQSKCPVQKYMLDEGREHFEMTKLVDDIETNDEAVKLEDQYIVELKPLMNKHRSGNIKKDDPKEYRRNYYREYNKSEKQKEYKREYKRQYNKSEKQKEYMREYNRQYRLKKKLEKKNQDPLF